MNKNMTALLDENKRHTIFHFLKRPKNFQGTPLDSLEAEYWIDRMTEFQRVCNFSDREMIFLVGDYLTGAAKDWYRVVGSLNEHWFEFIDSFRMRFVHNGLLMREKMAFINRVEVHTHDEKRLLNRAFESNEDPSIYNDGYD